MKQKLVASRWKDAFSPDGLRSPLWLLVYEMHRKQWLNVVSAGSFVENDPFFGPLLKSGVYFYDENRNVRKLKREARQRLVQRTRIQFVTDHLSRYF